MSQISGSCKGESSQDLPQSPHTEQARLIARSGETNPELAQFVSAWPALPEAIKTGIMAMVKASTPAQAPSDAGGAK
jgi:hypothetical protein